MSAELEQTNPLDEGGCARPPSLFRFAIRGAHPVRTATSLVATRERLATSACTRRSLSALHFSTAARCSSGVWRCVDRARLVQHWCEGSQLAITHTRLRSSSNRQLRRINIHASRQAPACATTQQPLFSFVRPESPEKVSVKHPLKSLKQALQPVPQAIRRR